LALYVDHDRFQRGIVVGAGCVDFVPVVARDHVEVDLQGDRCQRHQRRPDERLRALQARFLGVERREDDPVRQWMRVNVAGDCQHCRYA